MTHTTDIMNTLHTMDEKNAIAENMLKCIRGMIEKYRKYCDSNGTTATSATALIETTTAISTEIRHAMPNMQYLADFISNLNEWDKEDLIYSIYLECVDTESNTRLSSKGDTALHIIYRATRACVKRMYHASVKRGTLPITDANHLSVADSMRYVDTETSILQACTDSTDSLIVTSKMDGMTNCEIANMLGKAESFVRYRLARIEKEYRK